MYNCSLMPICLLFSMWTGILVTGNCLLLPSCSLFSCSLIPSLTVFSKVEKFWLPCLDLILSPPLTQTVGRNFRKSRVESPFRKVKNILTYFLFIFKVSLQNWLFLILTIFWYLGLLFRNQIKHVENIYFYWYLIGKTRY